MSYINIARKGRQPVYASNDVTNAAEVSALVKTIRKNEMNKVLIHILTGTHGDEHGNLVGEKVFFVEDELLELQTVKAHYVKEDTSKNSWKRYFNADKSILILAWCYSDRWKGLATYNT